MKHLKKSFALLILLTAITGSRIFAQDYLGLNLLSKRLPPLQLEVLPDNEYTRTGYEQGIFYDNPLMVDGRPVQYKVNLQPKGELTVVKGAAITGDTTLVRFNVYLRRNGNKIFISREERSAANQTKMEISHILQYAKPGDQLVIEAVKKEDGGVKRIFLVREGDGC